MATPGAGSSDGTSSQFAQLLSAIQKVEANVDAKLSHMKRELMDERESADERLVKKIRMDSKPSFRKKSHEKQYVFNEQVRDKLDSAAAALGQTPPAVEKARDILKEGEKLIDVRQKNIKIADRSEHGWATVAEYEEDELADNSDDEKRLFRAEVRAGRKLKQKSAKDTRRRGGASRKPYRASAAGMPPGGEHARSSDPSVLTGLQSLVAQFQGQKQNVVSGGTGSSLLGPCFECGRVGHYKKNCPRLAGSQLSAGNRY